MTDMPAASVLIKAARAAMREAQGTRRDPVKAASHALDRYAPAIDEQRDIRGIAAFLGLKSEHSLRRNKWRTRGDGTPAWPEPDGTYGGTDTWRLRTVVIHLAGSPGHGRRPAGYAGRVDRFAAALQAATPDSPVTASGLVEASGFSRNWVLGRLAELRDAGLVTAVSGGRYVRYAAMSGADIRAGLAEISDRRASATTGGA